MSLELIVIISNTLVVFATYKLKNAWTPFTSISKRNAN
jgi:hypothetical protein